MAQFDVYVNRNHATRQAYPFLVDVQHSVLSDIATRLVVPLTALNTKPGMHMKRVTPEIVIEGTSYLFMTPLMASVSSKLLRDPVGTLESARYALTSAIDFAITGI
ncbi:CcdB family protein [Alteromonas sp. RKMC-009]|uniref:CcdB family protein n=1 Tax=Alteromonas sp. RKMC-009 TaxID=2267264 RepID=UPI000E68EC40|nr:CcdB family protein [Alteromonas sp. RKMC-009]AYA66062.1 plasmid maintenance protein CcdB [Alteromonas sp. RKMC-009]